MSKHMRFLPRTVMVKNNEISESFTLLQRERITFPPVYTHYAGPDEYALSGQLLNPPLNYRILNNEGIMRQAIRWERFEKPCVKRQRLCQERCRRIYDSEMKRKIQFLMRKNRRDPFPR